jgi:hypothetical protein
MSRIISIILLSLFISSCKIPPFNPKADLRFGGFLDSNNVSITSLKITGSVPHNVIVSLQIPNGIDTAITGYRVDYYDVNGNKLAASINKSLSVLIAGTGNAVTSISSNITVSTTNQEIVTYALSAGLTEITAKMTFTGKDINDNTFSTEGSITLYF